jgi:hypothetical protein
VVAVAVGQHHHVDIAAGGLLDEVGRLGHDRAAALARALRPVRRAEVDEHVALRAAVLERLGVAEAHHEAVAESDLVHPHGDRLGLGAHQASPAV